MIRAPHFLAEKPAAAALPKGVPRPWWEGRPFVAAMIILAMVPLIYPVIPPIVDIGGHIGYYTVLAARARRLTMDLTCLVSGGRKLQPRDPAGMYTRLFRPARGLTSPSPAAC